MAHGFLAINGNNQVLVSSETRNLHFVGKALLNRSVRSFDGYGGLRHWAYQIACNVTPVPFFTMPVDGYYAVAAVRQVAAGVWEIEIIRSGTSDYAPEVYVFSDPRGATGNGGTNYGMLVMRDDGTPSFDSRLNPLAVTGGAMVSPPANPLSVTPSGLSWEYCSSNASQQFAPNRYNEFQVSAGSGNTKPIFYYPSLAQAEKEVGFYGSRCLATGFYSYPCIIGYDQYGMAWWGTCGGYSCVRTLRGTSTYWAFYRAGIRFVGGHMRCGWITCEANCHYGIQDSSLGWVIGAYVPPTSASASGGQWPYSNETLNLQNTAVIIGNGARYD